MPLCDGLAEQIADRPILTEASKAGLLAAALQVLHARHPGRRFEIVPKEPAPGDASRASEQAEPPLANDTE